jgi:hypothetical protein
VRERERERVYIVLLTTTRYSFVWYSFVNGTGTFLSMALELFIQRHWYSFVNDSGTLLSTATLHIVLLTNTSILLLVFTTNL